MSYTELVAVSRRSERFIYDLKTEANLLHVAVDEVSMRKGEMPRALGGPGAKLGNEPPCERNEEKIFSITPFRLT